VAKSQADSATGEVKRWPVLMLCLVAGFMTLLDVSIVNVALPSMQRGLNASPAELAWVVSGYVLTFGLVLVPAGRLGDDHGRSRMFLLALFVFTLASALAGVAQHSLWLVGARLLQGCAGGLLNPQVFGLIQQFFQGRERARAFGMFGAVVGISTAIGPLLGGLLIQLAGAEHGWRLVFLVNLPLGAAALLYGYRILPARQAAGRSQNLDPVGVLLLASALSCILLPLIQHGQGAGPGWLLLAAAPFLLAGFIAWERWYDSRGRTPLVNLRLLKIRSYSFGSLLSLLYFAGFTSIFFVLALFFQNGLGYSPLQAGLSLTPFAVGSAVSSGLSGRLVVRLGRRVVVIGLVTALTGLLVTDVVLVLEPGSATGLATALPLLLAGTGSGLVISPNQTVTLSEIDPAQGGAAAGIQQTGQRIGSAVGTATASGLFFSFLSSANYSTAIFSGLLVSIGFVTAALLVAVVEGLTSRPVVSRS
jgi:EmrB/QacA subfamily drug resistance transporter